MIARHYVLHLCTLFAQRGSLTISVDNSIPSTFNVMYLQLKQVREIARAYYQTLQSLLNTHSYKKKHIIKLEAKIFKPSKPCNHLNSTDMGVARSKNLILVEGIDDIKII